MASIRENRKNGNYYEKTYSGNNVTLTLANNAYEGDIWNGTGYYGENGDVLTVTLDNADLTGRVCLSTAPHAIALEGRNVDEILAAIDEANAENAAIVYGDYDGLDPIEYEFLDADGNVCGKYDAAYIHFTKWSVNQYYLLGHVVNFVNVNGAANINVLVPAGSTWTVTDESVISYLKVEGTVYGTVTENADGTITVLPGTTTIPAGEYGSQAVAGASGEMGGPGASSEEPSGEASYYKKHGGKRHEKSTIDSDGTGPYPWPRRRSLCQRRPQRRSLRRGGRRGHRRDGRESRS